MPTAAEQAQIVAIVRGIHGATERAVRRVALDLHANLVEHTPVDTGYARANWVPRVGRPLEEPVGPPGSSGVSVAAEVARAGVAQVATYRLPQGRVFVSNNVPYIVRLNDGHSRQEPAGFVQRAVADAVADAVRVVL